MIKRFFPKIILAASILVAIFLWTIRDSLRKDWQDLTQALKITIDNFLYELSPEKSRPLTTIDKEERLKLLMPDPFMKFSRQEWEDFWELIYGVYKLEAQENPRLPKRNRQLTISEIEERLSYRYPTPFSYFKKEHWSQFWQIVLRK